MASEFDPNIAAKIVLQEFQSGDIIPTDDASRILEVRMPRENDFYGHGCQLRLTRLSRFGELRNVLLLEYHVHIHPAPNGSIELIKREHQVDRGLQELKKAITKELRKAARVINNLDLGNAHPDVVAEQRDALSYIDALKHAFNPRARYSNKKKP